MMTTKPDSMKHPQDQMITPPVLRLMGAIVLTSLALVTFAVVMDVPHGGTPKESPIVAERSLIIRTGGAQAVTLYDADGTLLEHLDHGGFVTVIGSGIDRNRTVHKVAKDSPVTLVRRENGRFSVIDPETGWSVELTIFGSDNEAAFAKLLPAPGGN
jgi:putative photosynthetic complex assembly protein